MGTGVFSEADLNRSDLWGIKSNSMQSKISEASRSAYDVLIQRCYSFGANAVIGLDYDYILFQNNAIGVIANGTAVYIEKEEQT